MAGSGSARRGSLRVSSGRIAGLGSRSWFNSSSEANFVSLGFILVRVGPLR